MAILLESTYFLSIISFLTGLKYLSTPRRAKMGNLIASFGMMLAIVISFIASFNGQENSTNFILISIAIIFGTLVGKILSNKVQMTQMPQLVSLFNATGGACAVLLVIVESNQGLTFDNWQKSNLLLGLFTGGIAVSGSIIALLKLASKIGKFNPGRLKMYGNICLLTIILLVVPMIFLPSQIEFFPSIILIVLFTLLYGIFFVLPIGGADMPVVISLLNATTGVSTAFAGALFSNKVMLAGGLIVGASGWILTFMMCKAMNRSLFKVIAGHVKTQQAEVETHQNIQETSYAETALQLGFAQKVAIIPGYGLALAQAQHLCKQLENQLVEKGAQVHYIIHPVAGRMPGHMNVLLAEANVSYEALKEMDEINSSLDQYDIALIIGANDVVNPAAESNSNSPIYGMPIIKAYKCKSAIVLKRSMSNGYAGIANELFSMPNCKLLFGDAKETLQKITNELKLV